MQPLAFAIYMAPQASMAADVNAPAMSSIGDFVVIPYITLSIFCALLNIINSRIEKSGSGFFLPLCAGYAWLNFTFIIAIHCHYVIVHSDSFPNAAVFFHGFLIVMVCLLIHILWAVIKHVMLTTSLAISKGTLQ